MKRITLFALALVMILQAFTGCALQVGATDTADGNTSTATVQTASEETNDVSVITFYSDSDCTLEVSDAADIPAGEKVYYKVIAAEGEVLEELSAGGASEITDKYFTVSDPDKFILVPSYVVAGDFNRDGSFGLVDVAWMLRYAAGWNADKEAWTITESIEAGDVNDDGDVTLIDIAVHIRTAAGFEYPFAAEQSGFNTRLLDEAERIDAEIAALGEITDIESAAKVSKLMEEYYALDEEGRENVTGSEKLAELVDTAVTFFNKEDMKLKVMSFNVRNNERTEDRMARVVQTISTASPDVFGIQEGTDQMCAAIVDALGDEYEMLGHGREDDRTGENCNIFYKKSKFELLQTETLWLGGDPDNYCLCPDATSARIMTYQLLKRKSDGQVFLHVNTHLDHLNAIVRLRQIEILFDLIDERLDGVKYPTFLTGDFNCEEGSREIRDIIKAGYEMTNKYGESTRTYQGYGNGSSIIDFCFVDACFAVESYKVCDEKIDGEWVSDHNAIVSELLLMPKYDSIRLPGKDALDNTKTYNVLFVGNSYTYYNDMPDEIFASIAESAGYTFNVKQLTKGGWALIDSANEADSLGALVDAELKATKYDYVILQEQSTNPILDPGKFYDGIRNMLVKIKENGATPILYSTWGRKDGSDTLYENGWTNESMTWMLAASYEAIAKELGIEVAHVGLAFHDVYTQKLRGVELYDEDLTHPSYCGSMLAALTIFTEITGVDPTEIEYSGTIIDRVAGQLKEAASKAVFATPEIPEEYETSSEGVTFDGE